MLLASVPRHPIGISLPTTWCLPYPIDHHPLSSRIPRRPILVTSTSPASRPRLPRGHLRLPCLGITQPTSISTLLIETTRLRLWDRGAGQIVRDSRTRGVHLWHRLPGQGRRGWKIGFLWFRTSPFTSCLSRPVFALIANRGRVS